MTKLLIADDEITIRNGLNYLISSSDLPVTICDLAIDGEDAFKKILQHQPDIILMDINMPRLNGLDAIAKIREINQGVKIIIVSGYNQFEYAQRALDLGVFSYILKPIDHKKLLETIERAAKISSETFKQHYTITSESCKNSALDSIAYINEHFMDNEITLTLVAQKFHISQSYLTKLIKQKTGSSFSDYLNHLRLDRAAKFLKCTHTHYTIAQISEMVGYSSQHYFSRAFKKHFGLTPNHYRK